MIRYGDAVIYATSFVKKSTALITTEAEYSAVDDSTKSAHWLRDVLAETNVPQRSTK